MTEATHSDSLVIGVDIGGTKMAAGLVDPEGDITEQVRASMAPNGDDHAVRSVHNERPPNCLKLIHF